MALIVPALAVLVVRRSLRRRAEREFLEIELEAERAQNREREELIASLSHQIRTPLAGVYGFSEAMADFLKAGMADQVFLEEAANTIFTQSFEIRRLVDDLFVAARDDSGTLAKSIVEVDVQRAAATALEPFSKSGITAVVDVEAGWVLADSLRLQHILRNLIHNASNHGGGNIALGAAQTPRPTASWSPTTGAGSVRDHRKADSRRSCIGRHSPQWPDRSVSVWRLPAPSPRS